MKASTTFKRLTSFLGFSVPLRDRDFAAQIGAQPFEIDRFQQDADRFRADHGGEAVLAIFILRLEIFLFAQELAFF